jgi:hypothetical protein
MRAFAIRNESPTYLVDRKLTNFPGSDQEKWVEKADHCGGARDRSRCNTDQSVASL